MIKAVPSDTAAHGANQIEEEKRQLEELMSAVTKKVRSKRLEVWTIFNDFSATRWAKPGYVTREQFARAMNSLGFRFSAKQLAVFCQAYCDSDLAHEINYVAFCRTIDPSLRPKAASATKVQVCTNIYFTKEGKIRPSSA